MVAPTLMLWLCAIAFGIASAMSPDGMPTQARLASDIAVPLVIALWVIADARKRGRRLCYDYDSFVYFAWPVVVPVYLFQTRGVRALLTLLCFGGLWLIGALSAGVVLLVRESAP
jgi:hypothetical protein